MIRNKELKFEQVFTSSNEGGIVQHHVKTLKYYLKLTDPCDRTQEVQSILGNPKYFFYAFTKENFWKGRDEMIKAGGLTEGEKVVNMGSGIFCSHAGKDLYIQALKSRKEKIREHCDPQEIYNYEFNNYESMYDWDGDENAINVIIDYFGLDVAKTIHRYNAYKKLD